MRYFECLVAETSDYQLRIVEYVPEMGFCLIVRNKHDRFDYIPSICMDTLQECKEVAAKKYGVTVDVWCSEGKYWESLMATTNDYLLRIVEAPPEIGFYLYLFDNDSRLVRDDLQNTLQDCKEIALEMYNIPMDAWQEEKVQ
ncbi:MAG: hypothetical protein ACX93T_01930 [Bacteroidota bacterium]